MQFVQSEWVCVWNETIIEDWNLVKCQTKYRIQFEHWNVPFIDFALVSVTTQYEMCLMEIAVGNAQCSVFTVPTCSMLHLKFSMSDSCDAKLRSNWTSMSEASIDNILCVSLSLSIFFHIYLSICISNGLSRIQASLTIVLALVCIQRTV